MNLHEPPRNIQEILKLLSRVPTGRALLERFLPAHQSGRVRIEGYPLELLTRLREALGPGQPVGACFLCDGDQGTIHLDLTSPLGVLAPFLVHEIVHSLDPAIWEAARRALTREARDRVMLETETLAFETQHRFLQEMKNRFPDYAKFLKARYPAARILHDRLTSTDVAELYGFARPPKAC